MKNIRIQLLLSACAILGGADVAVAQQAGSGTAQRPLDANQLQEIIVTAQRKAQTLQDVPVSVAVIDSTLVQQQHVTDISGLSAIVPNLSITKSPFQPFVSIRGLGSGAGTRAFEQSVATYVDGIYAGRANQFLNPFFDIERVEVVRGPQSVLFGVNAIAGAINVVNRKPGKELEGYITSGYEFENGGYNFEGGISIPLTDSFGVRLAGRVNREGPYLKNTVTGQKEPDTRSQIGRIVASWQPSSDFRADLEYEHAHKKVEGSGFETTYLPLASVFPPEIEDGKLDFTKSSPGTADFTRLTTDGVTLNLTANLGEHILTSSSGYSRYSFDQALPAGAVPVFFGTALDDEKFKQFYQEVRLQSPTKQFFEYLLGAAYYHQDSQINQGTDFDLTAFGAPGVTAAIRNQLDQKTDGYSAFGQATFNFSETINLVGGLRYSSIKKRANYVIAPTSFGAPLSGYPFVAASEFILNGLGFFSYLNPADPSTIRTSVYDRSRTFHALNPSVSLNWKPSRAVSFYGSYTTGTKAGGFNDQEKSGIAPENGFALDSFEYDKEKASNFEVGSKLALGRMRVNFAAFYAKYKDLQASQAQQNGSILTTNAASATAKGFEVDATVLVAPGFTIGGDFAYIHARYDDYPGSGCIITLTSGACDPSLQNAKGGRLDAVPDFTGSVNAQYKVPLNDRLELRTGGRIYYNDGAQYQSNQDPLDRTPHYWLFDASIELAQVEKGFSIALSGKNLANKVVRGFSAPAATPLFGHQSYITPGRTIYVDLRFDF